MSIKNPLSDFEIREKVVLNPSEYVEDDDDNNREPPCHFKITWEGSKKRSTMEVLSDQAVKTALKKQKKGGKKKNKNDDGMMIPREMTADDSNSYVPILALECRGIEPYQFHPMGNEFIVISEGGTKFDSDIDLDEGDWADYDADHDISVSISEFESKFITL